MQWGSIFSCQMWNHKRPYTKMVPKNMTNSEKKVEFAPFLVFCTCIAFRAWFGRMFPPSKQSTSDYFIITYWKLACESDMRSIGNKINKSLPIHLRLRFLSSLLYKIKSIFCPIEICGCSHKHGGKPWATVPRLEAAKHTHDSFHVKEVALVSRRHASRSTPQMMLVP